MATIVNSVRRHSRDSFVARIEDYDIFIEVDGSGPFMVMTHGLGAGSNVFYPLMEAYSEKYTVVRFDWPGLGKSSLNLKGEPLSVPGYINVLEGVLNHLHIDSAILVGHSLGGIISMHYAAQAPNRVAGLAVIGAGRTRATDGHSKSFTLELSRQARADGTWKSVDNRVAYNIPKSSPTLARALLRQVTASTDPEGYAQTCEALCAKSHIDPQYRNIVCPTVIIGGEFDNISPIEVTEELCDLISASGKETGKVILSTGHMIIIEDVDGTVAAIDTILACEQFVPGKL